MTRRIRHARTDLALQRLDATRSIAGPEHDTPLLLLHALHGSSADWRAAPPPWSGPSWALDLAGHGDSEWLKSGMYYPEMWAGDADAALAELGDTAVVVGAGIGAYVALLLSGARPRQVRGTALLAGQGLEGGGEEPDFANILPSFAAPADRSAGPFDPRVSRLGGEPRPAAYAADFARRAARLVLVEDGGPRPGWWQACRPTAGSPASTLDEALARLRPEPSGARPDKND